MVSWNRVQKPITKQTTNTPSNIFRGDSLKFRERLLSNTFTTTTVTNNHNTDPIPLQVNFII